MHFRIKTVIRWLVFTAGCIGALHLFQCEKSPTEPDDTLYNLRITEIHFNPSGTDRWIDDSLEFIELKNIGASTVDVGSLGFIGGIDFTFPANATIAPYSFYLIASNEHAFASRYGNLPDAVYRGQLKNSGETIEVFDWLTEKMIFTVTYGDSSAGWPIEADGGGYSLVTNSASPDSNSSDPAAWRRSVHRNGSPGKDDLKLPVLPDLYNLRITEIHYHPQDPDTSGGDSLEFIELKNSGTTELNLGRVAFTEGITCTFSNDAVVDAGAFFVLASNKDEFQRRYDKLPDGVFTGQLSNSGETVLLEDIPSGEVLIKITYSDVAPWPTGADGDGYSLVPYRVTPESNQNSASAWRRSFRPDGSPGADDHGIVVVNEVLSNPPASMKDAIELHNPGDANIDISGWFLTDQKNDPVKFVVPEGTVIAAGGFKVFTEDDFQGSENALQPFSLSVHGEEVYLMSDSDGCKGNGYCHGFSFGELEEGNAFGRYITPSENEVYTTLNAITLGSKNSAPKVGPVIISEIAYRSPDEKKDFIEITNIGSEEIRLYDPQNPSHTWKIDGIAFLFPVNMSISPGESMLILSNALPISEFVNEYGVADTIEIFQFTGALPDDKQKITLLKPEPPYSDDSTGSVPMEPYMIIDEVKYSKDAPWPTTKGSGEDRYSLQRKAGRVYGNDPGSWIAALPAPGAFTAK